MTDAIEVVPERLKTTRQLVEDHPNLFTVHALRWAARRAHVTKIDEKGILFRGRGKSLLWDEERTIRWWLNS